MEIISRKLANDRLYGYEKGVFWVWDEDRKVWKESILMGKQYGLNREADKSLTPADFLADPSRFCPLEDYEVEYGMKNARRVRKDPEKQAPVTQQAPARTAPAVPEKQAEAAENPAEVPEFDYSGLDEKGVADLHTAEAECQHGKRLAERPAGESDLDMDHSTVCSCLTSMMAMWRAAIAALTSLQGNSLRTASECAEETARSILQDVGALVPELAPEQPDQPQK